MLYARLWGLFICLCSLGFAADEWRPVKGGILYGISDLALVEHSPEKSVFLCVHDNKRRGEPRSALIVITPKEPIQYVPVDWEWHDDLIDLESLTRIPGKDSQYMAMTSRGQAYLVELKRPENKVVILSRFLMPALREHHNFEGLCLMNFGEKTLIVWGHRGEAQEPGTIFFGELDWMKKEVRNVQEVEIRVPWPLQYTRHISDMKLGDAGTLLIASASDPGDDGPFQSAIYMAGVFYQDGSEIKFKKSQQMVRIRTIYDHKVEAFELVPGLGGVILGSDDENFGGWVYYNW